jgi:hypothetical protein
MGSCDTLCNSRFVVWGGMDHVLITTTFLWLGIPASEEQEQLDQMGGRRGESVEKSISSRRNRAAFIRSYQVPKQI